MLLILLAFVVAVFSNATVDPKSILPAEPDVEGKGFCSVCSLLMMIIEDAIDFDMTREELVKWVSGLCVHLPSSLKKVCTNFIDKELNKIIDLLLNNYPVEKICSAIGACTSNNSMTEEEAIAIQQILEEFINREEAEEEEIEIPIPDEIYDEISEESIDYLYENGYAPVGRDSLLCEVCEVVIKHVEDYVTDPDSMESVEEILRNVCNFLSGTFKKICVSFINKEYEKLISLIVEGLPPREVCAKVHAC